MNNVKVGEYFVFQKQFNGRNLYGVGIKVSNDYMVNVGTFSIDKQHAENEVKRLNNEQKTA